MAYQNSIVSFEKMLLEFIADEDPMQSMIKWLCERLMKLKLKTSFVPKNQNKTMNVKDTAQTIAFDALTQDWEQYITGVSTRNKENTRNIFHRGRKPIDLRRFLLFVT